MEDQRRLKSRNSPPCILIAAGDADRRRELADLLSQWSSLGVAATHVPIFDHISRYPTIRLIIVVEQQSDDESLQLLERVKTLHERIAVLIMSTHPTIEHATEAIRRGAEDFIGIPCSIELLQKEVARILEAAELRDGIQEMRRQFSAAYGFEQIVSSSPLMNSVFQRALAASRSDTPVLITGETGTGKELLARAIHANSRRHEHPFVAINCAALPRELVESELFGHLRGAFSGAHTNHRGLFSAAHHGTLMLDEIGELAADVQAKLLRVLQNSEVRPVGALESHQVDVRVIAATNRRIQDLRNGVLRQDLFFRMSVLVIEMPPLRERAGDIPQLIEYFLARYRRSGESNLSGIEPEALEMLGRYSFPGNIRELENFAHSMAATLGEERKSIKPEDVKRWMRRQGLQGIVSEEIQGLPLNLSQLETWAIQTAIERSGGNKSRAASLLGISRDSLYRKLQEIEENRDDAKIVRISDMKGN
jgi:DNA-binding NtrC family response regulator